MPEFHKGGGIGIAGAILVSGTYRLKADVDVPGQKASFGADANLWETRSSLKRLAGTKAPLLPAHGDIDVRC